MAARTSRPPAICSASAPVPLRPDAPIGVFEMGGGGSQELLSYP